MGVYRAGDPVCRGAQHACQRRLGDHLGDVLSDHVRPQQGVVLAEEEFHEAVAVARGGRLCPMP